MKASWTGFWGGPNSALRWPCWAAAAAAAAALLLSTGPALAARVTGISPQGDVAEVRQVAVRFDEAVVPAGDPRLPAPYSLLCEGASGAAPAAPPGNARWANERLWVYDLREPLAAGSRCVLRRVPSFVPLKGDLQGPPEARFATGAPRVLTVQPYAGARIEEDQHFLLRTNGAVDSASVAAHVWCEVEGLGERIATRFVEGTARAAVLRQSGSSARPEPYCSMQPRAPQPQGKPSGTTRRWPISAPAPKPPRNKRFSVTIAPPTPVPMVSIVMSLTFRPAPKRNSAHPAAFASLSMVMSRSTLARRFA